MSLGFIYMASGYSQRFGSNKLLHQLDGKPIYMHSLKSLAEASAILKKEYQVSIAVVSQYQEILAEAEKTGLTAVNNTDSMNGITSSIKLGLANLPESNHYAFFVADQPYFKPTTTVSFIKSYLESGKTIGCVSDGNILGNPVIFDRRYVPELLALEGDKGGKRVVSEHLAEVYSFSAEQEELLDIDSQSDLRKENRY